MFDLLGGISLDYTTYRTVQPWGLLLFWRMTMASYYEEWTWLRINSSLSSGFSFYWRSRVDLLYLSSLTTSCEGKINQMPTHGEVSCGRSSSSKTPLQTARASNGEEVGRTISTWAVCQFLLINAYRIEVGVSTAFSPCTAIILCDLIE